jgi:hypothetical protein
MICRKKGHQPKPGKVNQLMASQDRHKGRQPFEDLSFSKTSPSGNQENQGKEVIL